MDNNTAIQLLQMDNTILVDSRIVAKGINVEHETVMKTIYSYQPELEEFGILRFQIGEIKGRGQPEKYALLNRNQAGVTISFSRNTKEVVRFKVDLFKAIDVMEEQIKQLAQPPANTAIDAAYNAVEEARVHLERMQIRASKQIAEATAALHESQKALALLLTNHGVGQLLVTDCKQDERLIEKVIGTITRFHERHGEYPTARNIWICMDRKGLNRLTVNNCLAAFLKDGTLKTQRIGKATQYVLVKSSTN